MTYGKFLKITTFFKKFYSYIILQEQDYNPQKLYTTFSLQHVDVTVFITHFYIILLDFNIKQIFFLNFFDSLPNQQNSILK